MIKNYFTLRLARIISTAFLLFSIMAAKAQTLSGKVIDSDKNPIAFTNVILLKATDSIPLLGAVTDETGLYEISGIKNGAYILKVSYLGFETFFEKFTFPDKSQIDILLNANTTELESVDLVGRKPTVKREIDRLVFNVANTSLTEGNIWDVLNRTPGVIINQEEILVKNSGNVVVYINDRRVNLTSSELKQLLEGTAANNIQSIEVITNPPAKYDAEGGSVINIKMSKNLITGYNGNVFSNYTQGIFPKFAFGTGQFYKTNKINFFANYNYNTGINNRHNNEGIQFIENNQPTDRWATVFDRNYQNETHTLNTNFDYTIDQKSSLSLSSTVLYKPYWKQDNVSETEIFSSANVLDSTFNTLNVMRDESSNVAFQADYQRKLTENGAKMTVNAFYSNYYYNRTQDVNTDYFLPDKTFIRNNGFDTDATQSINIFTAQAGYEGTLKNGFHVETGAKISTIDSNNELKQFNVVNGQSVLDTNESNTFFYDETVLAGYLSLDKNWDKWQLKLGLRGEYADITGNSPTLSLINNQFNLKWFPTLYLGHTVSDNLDLSMSYGKRITRPRYEMLNPFRNFLTDNAFSGGNPDLNPAITHKVTLDITAWKRHTFGLYFDYIKGDILELSFQDNTNRILKYASVNLDRTRSVGLDYSTYFDFTSFWSFYGQTSTFYDEVQFIGIESNNALVTNNRISNYTYISNSFSLLKDKSLSADLTWFYISPIVQASTDVTSRQTLSLSLVKKFLKNKWVVSLQFNDIYNKGNFETKTQYLNQDSFYKARFESQTFKVGLRYNFGNQKLSTNQKDIEAAEKDRLGKTP